MAGTQTLAIIKPDAVASGKSAGSWPTSRTQASWCARCA
jgi:hypothetical protein